MHLHELLIEPIAYLPPAQALDGLTPEQADQVVPGANHSIAQILAHVLFWQEWFCRRCEGEAVPMPGHAAEGWPEVTPGSCPELQRRFIAALERAAFFEREDRLAQPITPAIEFPPIANYTIGDALVHNATHNAYHLGQIILLRQILGLWPPPGGSYTW